MPPHEQALDPVDPREFAVLSDVLHLLSERPLFAPDSAIVEYVTERVSVLCGDEYEMPRIIVRDSKHRNACVLSGYMIVDSGLLDLFEFEEELDSVLGHEVTHLTEEHTEEQRPSGLLEQIGHMRGHEVEADIGSMTLLDRRGINPRGAISAFAKLAGDTPGKAHLTTSPTHGQNNERGINIDQSFFLYDARSLSDAPLTPLRIRDRADRGRVVETITDPAIENDPIIAQALVARKIRSFDPDLNNGGVLVEQQATLLERSDPSLSRDDALRMAKVVSFKYRNVDGEPLLADSVMADSVYVADAEQLIADMKHPAVLRQCGSFDQADRHHAAAGLASKAMDGNTIETDEMAHIAETLYTGTGSHRFLVPGIRAGFLKHSSDRVFTDRMARLVAPTSLQMETFNQDILDRLMLLRFRSHIGQKRLDEFHRLQAAGDTLAVLQYVAESKATIQGDEFSERVHEDEDELEIDILTIDYEAYAWHEYAAKGEIASTSEDGPTSSDAHLASSPVWQYTTDLTDRRGLRKQILSLAAKRDEIGIKRTAGVAELLIDTEFYGFSSSDAENLARQMELLPALVLAGRKGEIKKLLEASLVRFYAVHETGKQVGAAVVANLNDLDKIIDEALVGKSIRKKKPDNHYRVLNEQWESLSQIVIESISDKEYFYKAVGEISDESDIIRDYRLLAALEQFRHDKDPAGLLGMLGSGGVPRIRGGGAFVEESRLNAARSLWEASAAALLKEPNLLTDDQHLLTLVALGMCAESVEVNLQTPSEAMRLLVQHHSFDEGLALVFDTFVHLPFYVMHGAVDELIENKARSLDDFAKLDSYMQHYVSQFMDDEQAKIGLGSIIETNLIDAYKTQRKWERDVGTRHDTIGGMESSRLIGALLSTVESDEAVRQYVFERWWVVNRTTAIKPKLEGYFKVEDIAIWRHKGKEARLAYWINELPEPGEYSPVGETLDNLYLSNTAARYIAVRKILLGEGGVLADAAGRESLVDGLMGSWLKYEEGSGAQKILHNLLSSLMSSAQSDELYKMVGPILQELILRPPRKPAANSAVAHGHAERMVAYMAERGHLPNPTDADINNVYKKILNLMRGSTSPPKRRGSAAKGMLELFGDSDAYEFKRISPTELALMAGKKSGSLGVRMLQLAGQYYDIPEEERDTYNEVYDSMKGQTRIQAYRVLMREAQHSASVAALLEDIASIDERLGGGSLVTVYGITLKNGHKEIIGIRNPNAQYHVGQLATVIQGALSVAVDQDPDNLDLRLAQSLIVDAVTWIRDELNDTEFTAKDTVFRAENDTVTGNGFRKGRSRYDLYVPAAPPTDSAWVRRETRVDGENLGNLKVSDDEPTSVPDKRISRADYQDAISLLARDYIYQMKTGKFLHSDIHPGNFRITTDNRRLAVFDRYNLIPVTDELRGTMKQVFQAGFSGDTQGAIEAIARYAAGNEATDTAAVASRVAATLQPSEDLTASMAQTIIELKKAGLNIPIQLSLLLRNIFGLSRLATKAGFSNLVEAFAHTAEPDEIAETLTFFA